jgi:hypothetical protein
MSKYKRNIFIKLSSKSFYILQYFETIFNDIEGELLGGINGFPGQRAESSY